MTFTGFGEDAFDFYEGLVADNSKAYWADHTEQYRTAVREPMEALLADLEPEFGAGSMFRPYRDVRFSKDKSPYKDHAGAVARRSDTGGFYVQLSADGLYAAAGYYQLAPHAGTGSKASRSGPGPEAGRRTTPESHCCGARPSTRAWRGNPPSGRTPRSARSGSRRPGAVSPRCWNGCTPTSARAPCPATAAEALPCTIRPVGS